MYFEYEDNNSIVKDENGRIIFSDYTDEELGIAICPVPYKSSNGVQRPEPDERIGLDNNWYQVSYYHEGWILNIDPI